MLAIVQARTSSQRLPGKVLREVHGMPLLGYLLARLARSRTLERVVVATSNEPDDDAIERFCNRSGVVCIRGSLDDVAARFRLVIEHTAEAAFVRISADSPLIDPAIVDRAVSLFRSGEWDLATNVARRTFPKGQSVEVLASSTFIAASRDFTDAADKEHVTPYFYRHRDRFRVTSFESDRDLGTISMAIDTAEDLDRFTAVVKLMKKPHINCDLDELVGLYASLAPA